MFCAAKDVARWIANESKDIASIGAHVGEFSTQIDSLKCELSEEQKKNKDASTRIASTKKEAAVERETSASLRRQYEAKLKVCTLCHSLNCCVCKRETSQMNLMTYSTIHSLMWTEKLTRLCSHITRNKTFKRRKL